MPKPKPVPPIIKPPVQLKGTAKDEWDRVVPLLISRGILDEIDTAELAFYCITYGRWQDAEDMVFKQGFLIKTKSGNVIHHPALGVANTAMKMCHKFCVEFGLTPRKRVKADLVETDEAPPGFE